MKSDARWMAKLAPIANAVVGGFWFAFVGACCGGFGGATMEVLFDISSGGNLVGLVIIFGIGYGFASGVMGAFIYAVAAARSQPGQLCQPFHDLQRAVTMGQCVGELGACTSFLAFELLKAEAQNIPFGVGISRDIGYFFFGAPALMICGAIAGALFKRDWPKVATLNAE